MKKVPNAVYIKDGKCFGLYAADPDKGAAEYEASLRKMKCHAYLNAAELERRVREWKLDARRVWIGRNYKSEVSRHEMDVLENVLALIRDMSEGGE